MSSSTTAPAVSPEIHPSASAPRQAAQGSPVRALVVVNLLLAVVYSLYGTFLLLGAGLFSSNLSVMGRQADAPSRNLLFGLAGLTFGVALVLLVAAVGLKQRRPWARVLTLILGALAAVVALLSARHMDLVGIGLNGIYSAEVFVILLSRRGAAEFRFPHLARTVRLK